MLRRYGDDFTDNARGIYYADEMHAIDRSKLLWDSNGTEAFDYVYRHVLRRRRLFIPSSKGIGWHDPCQKTRRERAVTASSNALSNGQWKRSEFAWDADARRDIFEPFRSDARLDM